MVEREPQKEIALVSVGGLNMAICCGGLHILSSLNQLNQRKRKTGNFLDVSCFVWGRIMLGQCFLFFILLEKLNQNTYLQMPIWPIRKDFKRHISKIKKMENLADLLAWVRNEREFRTTKLFLMATLN